MRKLDSFELYGHLNASKVHQESWVSLEFISKRTYTCVKNTWMKRPKFMGLYTLNKNLLDQT